jgi:hypothetical protein
LGTTHLSIILLVGSIWGSHAQLPPWTNPLPVVTIYATEPHATWSGDPGQFTAFRAGPTNMTLNVYYRIGGTATNGVDYNTIGNWITIPAGVRSNSITISPINNGQTDTRTVELQLAPSPAVPPVNYVIGVPDSAVVFITPASTTNIPPIVRISTPPDGAMFRAPANVLICADAIDVDGYVSTVEFFAGTNSLGVRTNNPLSVGPQNPFCLLWTNVPVGNYALTALATDNGGATTLSATVNVSVVTAPPPTNFPPEVRIISPPNGAIFFDPATIPIYAFAHDFDDAVASVEFFDGTNSLGFGSNVCATILPPPTICPSNIYALVWSNAPVGGHVLRAKATDVLGAWSLSAPVLVSVVAPPPPPTNRPPIVSIFSPDPIAIEGTNCWPWLGLTNVIPSWTNWTGGITGCRFFTNCGPKNATFVVRRFGETNDDLNVTYSIGGTATNGVDYLPLSGSVTIPAGERRALITVVPLDDGPPDRNSTVVLRLQPSTNMPPAYLVGFPPVAAALIIDNMWPRPCSGLLADGSFHLNATGPDGAWFTVEYSTDMVTWTPISTSQVVNGSIDFIDPDAPTANARFYEAVPELNPPLLP